MRIHTTASGETLYDIARLYGVSPTKIIENNTLYSPDRLCVGQKLLILTPTRTYTVRGGDTICDIARRFSISERAILRRNPSLSEKRGAYPMQVIALKYDTPQNRSILYNGYFYKGCPEASLNFALSFSSHITVCAYKLTRGALYPLFDDKKLIERIKSSRAIPVMRIYIREDEIGNEEELNKTKKAIIDTATSHGYSGVCLAISNYHDEQKINEFIFDIKRDLMCIDKTLFLECDGGMERARELCDGTVLCYEKCHLKEIPSFDMGEKAFFTNDSETNDASLTFLDLSPFAYTKDNSLTIRDAIADAYRVAGELKYDADKMICYYISKKYRNGNDSGMVSFPSPENIKAKLELLAELGYMGISYDIMRTPVEWLQMSLSMFGCQT